LCKPEFYAFALLSRYSIKVGRGEKWGREIMTLGRVPERAALGIAFPHPCVKNAILVRDKANENVL
jgi:hypothetical protein